jgi:hypothetical protein
MQNLHQLTSESLTQIWGMSCYKLQSWCIRRVATLSLVALISLLFLAFWPASKAKKILRMFRTGKEKVSNSISVLKWPTLSSYWSVILSLYMFWVWVSRSDHVELSITWPRTWKDPKYKEYSEFRIAFVGSPSYKRLCINLPEYSPELQTSLGASRWIT